MHIQEQTCTAEQGARLVELGVKPEALFWHIRSKSEKHGESIVYGWTSEAIAPAYSVAELGDMIPQGEDVNDAFAQFKCFRSIKEGYYIRAYDRHLGRQNSILFEAFGYTEASVRANAMIQILRLNPDSLPERWRQNPDDAAEVMKVKTAKEAM